MVFEAYAGCYDLLYRDKDYAAETAFVHRRLQALAPGARRVLDLGCGTGAHAAELAALGYEVRGVDLSSGMLARAERRRLALPPSQAARLRFEPADIRALRLADAFDAVVSLFHVMSYLTGDDDLAAALDAAARHLRPGGILLFDFWHGPGVLGSPPDVRVKRVEDDRWRITRLAEPTLHHERDVVVIDYHLFVEDRRTARLDQIRESHAMRYWFWPELQRHMRAAGLEPVGLWEWPSERPASAQAWLAYAACRRPAPAAAE